MPVVGFCERYQNAAIRRTDRDDRATASAVAGPDLRGDFSDRECDIREAICLWLWLGKATDQPRIRVFVELEIVND